jgi:hypothetical protein
LRRDLSSEAIPLAEHFASLAQITFSDYRSALEIALEKMLQPPALPVRASVSSKAAQHAARLSGVGRFCSGRVPELHNLIVLFEFFGYHHEARQLGGTEGRRDGDISSVAPLSHYDAADAGMIVPRIQGEPSTIKEHFVPSAEVHWCRIDRYADVTKITRAIPRRDVHASGQGHCKMSEVPANTAALFVTLGSGAIASRVVIAELEAIVSIVANSLSTSPAARICIVTTFHNGPSGNGAFSLVRTARDR